MKGTNFGADSALLEVTLQATPIITAKFYILDWNTTYANLQVLHFVFIVFSLIINMSIWSGNFKILYSSVVIQCVLLATVSIENEKVNIYRKQIIFENPD